MVDPKKLSSLKRQIKVLYWREIKWLYPTPAYQKIHDLQMVSTGEVVDNMMTRAHTSPTTT